MTKGKSIDEKIIFATSRGERGEPIIMIGIPKKAYEYMADGKTHNFNLKPIGLDLSVLLFGCEDHDQGMEMLTGAIKAKGEKIIDMRNQKFDIPENPEDKK